MKKAQPLMRLRFFSVLAEALTSSLYLSQALGAATKR